MPPPLGAGGIMFSGCPSVRPSVRKEELSPLQYHFKSLHIISRHYKKSLLRSQIYHGYEELSTDTNYPIWRRQKLPYMKKTRKKKQVCGAACFMAAEIKFSEDFRPKPEIPSFDLHMGPLVHPTNRNRFTACPSVRPSVRPSVCPSVRPERFPGICRRTHGGNGLKFYMLMYLDHLQNWLVYDYSLLILLILALFWLSETGQIWGFRAFPGECMEEMTWDVGCWCILTTFRTD